MTKGAIPLLAIVGRPNVGKSTLFNRLCGGHHAIVEDEPGVTRDRRYGEADWEGRRFRVVDTGGLDLDSERPGATTLEKGVFRQAMQAVKEAELVLFVVDARRGLVAEDRDAAEALRKSGRPVLWVANKVDRDALIAEAHELYALGADEVFPVSAQHGRGVAELCDAILKRLPTAPLVEEPVSDGGDQADGEEASDEEGDEEPARDARLDPARPIRIALVGRPNAGKSSLLNRYAGEERVIVDDRPGTTRDPVDSEMEIAGQRYVIIDTAGIRRRAKISQPMEKIAVAMAEKAVNRCDVCLLVVDAKEGLAEQEAKIAGLCDDAGRALVIVFNKLDLITQADQTALQENLHRQLQFVPWAKVVFASAKTGKGTQRILDAVKKAYRSYTQRVSTGALNRWFSGIVEKHPPSLYRGHPVKLYFIQQPQTAPPTFILSVNAAEGVHFSYRRYLVNQLREEFGLDGTPVRLVCRARAQRPRHVRPRSGTR